MRNCSAENNLKTCNCSYESCSRRGICCECITYHRKNRELPACYFDKAVERTYDRSIANFIKHNK